MTKTFRSTAREYQRSPYGAPDGVLSNPLAREARTSGEFRASNELERAHLYDPTFNAFSAATHEGRFVTFRESTPPAIGSVNHGSNLEYRWTYRIKTVVAPDQVLLEGFRAEFAGTGISYVIPASVDLTAASADFPEDTGPTGTGADGVDRSNTGPCEWQAISFPTAADARLKIYPFWVGRRTSSTVLRISDPFDNLDSIPTESSLQWHLRDRPAYTWEQLYKIIHQFILHCGWEPHQHRGKNNGVGSGGNFNDNVYCVQDWIYKSTGELDDTVMYLRWAMFNRANAGDGSDSTNNLGFDMAMYSAWDRNFASVSVPSGGSTTANKGNGVNALSAHNSTTANQHWAAQADSLNTATNSEPMWSPDSFATGLSSPLSSAVRMSSPFDFTAANRRDLKNSLNTPEGGDISEIRYHMFGDKSEIHILLEAPGFGSCSIGFGALKPRADANPNNFVTNFLTPNGSNVLLRIGGGSRGTAGGALAAADNGTDPTATTPPYQIGDRIQTVGQTVNSPISPNVSHAGEFIDSSTISDLPGLVEAVGILICDTVANITDASIFTIDDGLANPESVQIYEFDKDSVFPESGGDIVVDLVTGGPVSSDDVRNRIRDAINPLVVANFTWNGSTTVTTPDTSEVVVNDWIWLTTSNANKLFRITAINPNVSVTIDNPDGFTIPTGSGANTTRKAKHAIKALATVSARVDLTHGRKGAVGNVAIVDSNSEFLAGTSGMAGGGYAIQLSTLNNQLATGALVGEDPQPMFFFQPDLATTPFSPTGGTQGVFRVSNRANHQNATYRDHNGPGPTPGNESSNGFTALAELSGMFGPDLREVNPNERSGRFGLVTIHCRDTIGGQLRGSMRYARIASPRLGGYTLRRDRNGDWHWIVPFSGRANSNGGETNTNQLVVACGPIPQEMAFVE